MLAATTFEDLATIVTWAQQDSDLQHRDINPDFWLTGATDSYLAFKLTDHEGTVCFVRFDQEARTARLHTQFAPSDIVSKNRLVAAMIDGFERVFPYLQSSGFDGVVFESTSISLIAFMQKHGFRHLTGDDYKLAFEQKIFTADAVTEQN